MSKLRRLLAIALFSTSIFISSQAQVTESTGKEPRPYKVSNNGRQVTLKSSKTMQHVMLWTTDGHRIVEQKELNSSNYTFSVPGNSKLFFMMVGFGDGKIYTEKIGLR
jgi:hypothetical protein